MDLDDPRLAERHVVDASAAEDLGARFLPLQSCVFFGLQLLGVLSDLVGQDGNIYTFGDAKFFGTPASFHIPLNAPIQGMVATPDGNGYWLVASDGGVFAFGGAGFKGNTYTTGIESQLTKPMVGMAATPDGNGYWLGAADGSVFAYGGAQFLGNTYTIGIENQLSGPMTGLTEAP